jgi:hypothetical protein
MKRAKACRIFAGQLLLPRGANKAGFTVFRFLRSARMKKGKTGCKTG